MANARVISTGRVGKVAVHDPDDNLLHYKLQFGDGLIPFSDWFHENDVTLFGGSLAAAKVEVLDDDLLCAICFEEAGRAVELPCACNVTYCGQCWDRALARSFNASGDATCPTCRTPVCVDFDPDQLRLVFSRIPPASAPEEEECNVNATRQSKILEKLDVIRKLREQALPAQVKILQNHGRRNPALIEIARAPITQLRRMSVSSLKNHITALGGTCEECVEKDDLVNCLLQEAEEKQKLGHVLGENLAAATEDLPACVCGSSLIHVSGKERVMRHFDQYGAARESPEYQRAVNMMLSSRDECICLCDLCSHNLPLTENVWTCMNTDTTILHPTSYDICDECFMRHATCTEPKQPSAEPIHD